MDGYGAAAIGRRVRAYRRAAGFTAEQLAARVDGLTGNAVAKLENGRRVEVSTDLLVQLAWALQVPPLVLLLPLENPQARFEVGNVTGTVESLAYWIEGLPLEGFEPEYAAREGNAVHAAYQLTARHAVSLLSQMVEIVDGQDGPIDELHRTALRGAADASAAQLHASHAILDILRNKLGLEDG